MFSLKQKRELSTGIQELIKKTEHPELPKDREISFQIRIEGEKAWSWAIIRNNAAVTHPGINPHNEAQDELSRVLRKKGG